jgi:hypothetical protein
MSSWCAWPHIRIAHSSINVGPEPSRAPLGRPRERRRDRIGVGSVERDAGNAVPRRLLGEHARRRLTRDGRGQRGLVVLDAENRRKLARRADVDRLVPFAQRGRPFPA